MSFTERQKKMCCRQLGIRARDSDAVMAAKSELIFCWCTFWRIQLCEFDGYSLFFPDYSCSVEICCSHIVQCIVAKNVFVLLQMIDIVGA